MERVLEQCGHCDRQDMQEALSKTAPAPLKFYKSGYYLHKFIKKAGHKQISEIKSHKNPTNFHLSGRPMNEQKQIRGEENQKGRFCCYIYVRLCKPAINKNKTKRKRDE